MLFICLLYWHKKNIYIDKRSHFNNLYFRETLKEKLTDCYKALSLLLPTPNGNLYLLTENISILTIITGFFCYKITIVIYN